MPLCARGVDAHYPLNNGQKIYTYGIGLGSNWSDKQPKRPLGLASGARIPRRRKHDGETGHMIRTLLVATLLCMVGPATADTLDRKKLLELLPCKSAAVRMCDRSQGLDAAALWKCGATLAERQHQISQGCVAVLKRYGQL